VRTLEQRRHEAAADAGVLVGGVDAHRSDPGDRASQVGEAAPDDLAVALGDDARDAVQRQHQLRVKCGELRRVGLDRECVAVRDVREGVVEDPPAGLGVARTGVADVQIGGGEHDPQRSDLPPRREYRILGGRLFTGPWTGRMRRC
jgi:hypothetical protein